MKTVYTIYNQETNIWYVGQTNSFARRIGEHLKSWLLSLLWFWDKSLRTYENAKIDIFLSENPNDDERKQIIDMQNNWVNLLNILKI